MKMPVTCENCGEWVELNDCRCSDLNRKLVCQSCYDIHSEVHSLKEEIQYMQLDLDNDDEQTIGHRREWKREIKEKKARIAELGYNYDELIY